MDDSPRSSVSRLQASGSQRVVWPAVTSLLLVTGIAGVAAGSDPREVGKIPEQSDWSSRFGFNHSGERGALPKSVAASFVGVEVKRQPPATIDLASFNERFWGPVDNNVAPARLPLIAAATVEFDDSHQELPGEAAGITETRRDSAVSSPISVFSFDLGTARWPVDLAVDGHLAGDRTSTQPRPDLLSGVPADYAALAVSIAVEEEVDPNWVLSIMRAENARFDPDLVSSAGAVGLMQVMPKIGEAFGAHDLTDPELNIRAGTRFLRVLIDKYRNPVLIASAYNAGEPRVDAHRSLPLIRETADYVTRVVGYYTNATAIAQAPEAEQSSHRESSQPRRAGPAERAKSPMLVFSVSDPLASEDPLQQSAKAIQPGDPVKIVKEEVLQ